MKDFSIIIPAKGSGKTFYSAPKAIDGYNYEIITANDPANKFISLEKYMNTVLVDNPAPAAMRREHPDSRHKHSGVPCVHAKQEIPEYLKKPGY